MPCTVNAELLFRADTQLQTASARVVAMHEHGIELDRTIFYPMHTAPHIMSCVVVAPVTGGNITPAKARLDFDIDLQPCGGTHVRNTAEIGAIRVLKIRSEGKRNRRVEIALHDNPPT
jgi:Ser-tRNA(Ala) deacylase AlaX